MTCLRKNLTEKMPIFDNSIIELFTMIGCHWCKSVREEAKVDKYIEVLTLPLVFSFKHEQNRAFRVFGCALLEKTATAFDSSPYSDADFQSFWEQIRRVALKQITLKQLVGSLSEHDYLHVIARLYYAEEYEMIFGLAIGYILNYLKPQVQSFRTDYYYKGKLVFQIGVSLDEGMTQSLTTDIMKASTNVLEEKERYETIGKSAYFFETKLYEQLLDQLNIEKKQIMTVIEEGGLHTLLKKSGWNSPCEVYELLKASDEQEWKKASIILRNWGKGKNEH